MTPAAELLALAGGVLMLCAWVVERIAAHGCNRDD